MNDPPGPARPRWTAVLVVVLAAVLITAVLGPAIWSGRPAGPRLRYSPRRELDTAGYGLVLAGVRPWAAGASPEEIARPWRRVEAELHARIDQFLAAPGLPAEKRLLARLNRAQVFNGEGKPEQAYRVLEQVREEVEQAPGLAEEWLYTVIYFQGVTALRRGETDNCVLCRGESSCILPVAASAVHANPEGSRGAVKHFTEYLKQFPDDLEVRWLLNVAHMTLGEHPGKVDPAHRIALDRFVRSDHDVGRFRDVGHRVGVGRLNQAGGAIMDDFDGDGLFDLVVTSFDPTQAMALYRNRGDGTFEDATEKAGLGKQFGGMYCVQGDFDNDGRLDLFVVRGAWVSHPMRPSLLRNNGDGTFTDVTERAGLLTAVNSISAGWADYDNDGHLDLFVCCERQPNRLYRNRGDGTFEEVAGRAGLADTGQACKGSAWIDYDNDGYPDLFVNHLGGKARLYRNERDGTFRDVTKEMGIDGPERGFSCWAFDYDNDGWLDLFATSYLFTLEELVKGLQGQSCRGATGRLYRNRGGKGFEDVTEKVGLDRVFAAMGSNFGDIDNDGYLDFYLATGAPDLALLVPNRLFKNVAGQRFAEVTGPSGTGHLQKGHAVAIGDWDRDGAVDLFVQTGGVVNGDRYHNVLFQGPGRGNNWLSVKLVGRKTNRSAIGARIKVVTAGDAPLTIHRHVSSGSSFGANPLEQHIGLGKAGRVARIEVYWPTSGTTQVVEDVAVNQGVVITEMEKGYQTRSWRPVRVGGKGTGE